MKFFRTQFYFTAILVALGVAPGLSLAQDPDPVIECDEFVENASLGVPLVRQGLQLEQVDLVWQLPFDRDRIRSFVSIDVQERAVTPVRLYDISMASAIPGSNEGDAKLLDSSDWDRGAIDLVFCKQSGVVNGVMIAYYRVPGRSGPDGLQPWVSYYTTNSGAGIRAVQVNDDQGGYDSTYFQMSQTVEEATGVSVPDHVGQSLFLQAQIFAAIEIDSFTPPLYWPLGASLSGSQILIENVNNAIPALNTVTSVKQQGQELLDDDGVIRNLVPGSGPIEVYMGDEMQLLNVVEGRLEARLEPIDSTQRKVQGTMLHDLPVGSLRVVPNPWWADEIVDVPVIDGRFEFFYPEADSATLANRITSESHLMVWSEDADVPPLSHSLCALVYDIGYGTNQVNGCLELNAEEMRLLLQRDTPLDIGLRRTYQCRSSLGVPVSTIETFVAHAEAVLPSASWQRIRDYLNAGRDDTLRDSDGDGSICNHGELESGRYTVNSIRLSASRNVAKPLD